MKAQFTGSTTLYNSSGGLCDEIMLSEIGSFDALVAYRDQLIAEHPGFVPLFTLDDVVQATYTSSHARMKYELDSTDGYEEFNLPPECFEDGDYLGDFATKEEWPLALRNFREKWTEAKVADPNALRGILPIGHEIVEEWAAFQADPLSLVDNQISVMLVATAIPEEAFAAFPNGYFSCDLSPFQNAAIAKLLREKHGYSLFGIGASWLGFLADSPADATIAAAVAQDVAAVYEDFEGSKAALIPALVARIEGCRHLWVRYGD